MSQSNKRCTVCKSNSQKVVSIKTGTIYHKLVQYITNWYKISHTGTRYHKLVQHITNWYNISRTGTIYHKLVQYITNWYYISQTGTNDICPYKMYLQFNIILTSNISSPPRWEFCLSGINKISFG